jgi:hypothetical protein
MFSKILIRCFEMNAQRIKAKTFTVIKEFITDLALPYLLFVLF